MFSKFSRALKIPALNSIFMVAISESEKFAWSWRNIQCRSFANTLSYLNTFQNMKKRKKKNLENDYWYRFKLKLLTRQNPNDQRILFDAWRFSGIFLPILRLPPLYWERGIYDHLDYWHHFDFPVSNNLYNYYERSLRICD